MASYRAWRWSTPHSVSSRILRRLVSDRLSRLEHGQLTLVDENRTRRFGELRQGELSARVCVDDARFYQRVATRGSLGAAEAFIAGFWKSDDLVTLLRLFVRNASGMAAVDRGSAWWRGPLRRLGHIARRNTKTGSRRNIAAHYDLSNELFALFLDDTMTYSSGLFSRPDDTLREASLAKYDRICRKLRLSPADDVLEIGGGWGGFAIYAAREYGCRVTTTTISRQQYDLARKRIGAAGLADRITLRRQDYRDLTGVYDKLVSIEMIEAVGHEYLETYFRKCCQLLKPTGALLLQAITIPEQRYDAYRRSVDFIQKYIFPGGCLPSIGVISRTVGRATDMRITHTEDFASHYARTLACWRCRFFENRQAIRDTGASEEFFRTWDYYFSYCQAGFLERMIGVSQIMLNKPRCQLEFVEP